MGHPILIAGPCSAESLEQVLAVADALQRTGIDFFRAGIWKPRTYPGQFEGVGEPALEWLIEARRRYGVKVCCEVASASHVESCVRAGVDMVWLGARTTANPFQVQEIADSLRGVDIPVYVKNPVSHDLNLWCGAIERLSGCGVASLGAIHRGVSSNSGLEYRNDPAWDIAVGLRSHYPSLPLICDPSHIAGDSAYVSELSQRALDIGFDGLMVEVHPHPEQALSDALQQLTPEMFAEMLRNLKVREGNPEDAVFSEKIEQLRASIDDIDENILSLLGQRMAVSEEIGRLKNSGNVPILQSGRWEEVLSRAVSLGRRCGLSEEFVRSVFSSIHEESISRQN